MWPLTLASTVCLQRLAQLSLLVLATIWPAGTTGTNETLIQMRSIEFDSNLVTELCELKTFAIYDGYQLVVPEEKQIVPKFADGLPNCLQQCRVDVHCGAINYQHDERSCQLLDTTNFDNNNNDLPFVAGELIRSQDKANSFKVYARKICISDSQNKCHNRAWAFEYVIGYQLVNSNLNHDYMHAKYVPNVQTVEQCAQLCLNEQSLLCRSATYNRTSGHCLLSQMSRHTIDTSEQLSLLPRGERVQLKKTLPFSEDVFYLENECIDEPRKFCEFRQIKNHKIRTVDVSHANVQSIGECRELCLSSIDHLCRSYEYDEVLRVCHLSHLTQLTSSHIEEPYTAIQSVNTYEISTCYKVSLACEPRAMKVLIETSRLFNGKIYAKSRPKKCVTDVTNQLKFELSLPYTNDNQNFDESGDCDTRQLDPGKFSNEIVIQHHDLVLTTKDLTLGVLCKFDLNDTSIIRIDLKVQGDILTDRLKGIAKLPELSLHVVDQLGREIDEVTIGDLLRVQIRMSDENTYGIFVRNLVAKDINNKTNNFTLIDNRGCPVQVKMMREIRTLSESSKSLESYMEAFTFTGGSFLLIEAEVETCLDKCRPMQCKIATGRSDDMLETVTSYGKRRRRSLLTDFEQADQGDILSMTMLSKSLFIKPQVESNNFGHKPVLMEFNPNAQQDVTKLTSPRLSAATQQVSKVAIDPKVKQSLTPPLPPPKVHFRRSSHSTLSKLGLHKVNSETLTSPFFRMMIGEKNFVCFEPLSLILFCALSFCVQGLIFTILFYALSSNKLTSSNESTKMSQMPLTMANRISENQPQCFRRHNSHHYIR